jgi:hypothetical protein
LIVNGLGLVDEMRRFNEEVGVAPTIATPPIATPPIAKSVHFLILFSSG